MVGRAGRESVRKGAASAHHHHSVTARHTEHHALVIARSPYVEYDGVAEDLCLSLGGLG